MDMDIGRSTAPAPAAAAHRSSDDLISELPEQIILHILTFLPLAFAIRTSVLSTRWRDLWRRRWPEPSNLNFTASTVSTDLFVAHVNHQLHLLPPPRKLDTLRIVFRPLAAHRPYLSNWINYAADCSVSDLLLVLNKDNEISNLQDFPLTRRFETLIRLRLGGCTLSPDINFIHLRSLEVVCLYKVNIDWMTLSNLVDFCSVLRNLYLRSCVGLETISVFGAKCLTSLIILDCTVISKFELYAPKLRSLHLRGEFLNTEFLSVSALEDVSVTWGVRQLSRLPLIKKDWVEELMKLNNVRVLSLCSLTLQYVTLFGSRMIFPNLRELQLVMHLMTEETLSDIYGFFSLCSCPCLEKLFIKLPTSSYCSSITMLEDMPPSTWFQQLKVIRMNNFNGYDNEMKLVRFLLGRAYELEYMILVPAQDLEDVADLRFQCGDNLKLSFLHNELISLPKASPNAWVILDKNVGYGWTPTHSEA